MRPLIGIAMRCDKYCENNNNIQYSFEFIRRTIIEAGGEPFYLTPPFDVDYFDTKYEDFPSLTEEEKKSIDFWLDSINGLVLPGGDKHTPYDMYILDECIKKKIPVLGLCLGMQIMSFYKVDNGKDNTKLIKSDIDHNIDINKKVGHTVKIDKQSLLYKIIGKEEIEVNSYHRYQAKPNPYYKITAVSPDGVIEALEMEGDVFHIGVQWHPEKVYNKDENAKKLIDAFIEESKKRKTKLDQFRV